jgi:hypothetical protein
MLYDEKCINKYKNKRVIGIEISAPRFKDSKSYPSK